MGIGKCMNSESVLNNGSVLGINSATPNDIKLSDRGVPRVTCVVGGKAAVDASPVKHGDRLLQRTVERSRFAESFDIHALLYF